MVFDPTVAAQMHLTARAGGGRPDEDSPLNARQRGILRLVADGMSNREIAASMHLSEPTIKGYVEEILQQLGARNRVHAAILATRRRWI
jgi:DNA-binding NarL/FixJ family response regulator